jgi:hypothetical protein
VEKDDAGEIRVTDYFSTEEPPGTSFDLETKASKNPTTFPMLGEKRGWFWQCHTVGVVE